VLDWLAENENIHLGNNKHPLGVVCRQQVTADNERLRQLQEAEAVSEAEAVAAARAVEYRNELRHRLDIQVMLACHANTTQLLSNLFCAVCLPLCMYQAVH